MKRGLTAVIATLIAAIAASGQDTAKPAPAESTNFILFVPLPTCPVNMHAQQGNASGLVAVRNGKAAEGPSQRIHLILTDASATRIVAAKVLVRGLSAKARVTQAASNANDTSELSRTLHVVFQEDTAESVAAELLLPGFTTVHSIELQALTYRDGSTWAVAGEQACHVAPDPLMLVDSR